MKNRTKISIRACENGIYLRTFSRALPYLKNFYILRKDMQRLISEKTLIVKDVYSFAELRCQENVNHNRTVNIRFLWMKNSIDGKVTGYDETICLPEDVLQQALLKPEYERDLLSISQTSSIKIEFQSRKNLKKVISQPKIRRKFIKTLSKKLNWKNYERMVLFDDFLPYSFVFDGYTPCGPGLSGGIILHGQEDLNTAYYNIHT